MNEYEWMNEYKHGNITVLYSQQTKTVTMWYKLCSSLVRYSAVTYATANCIFE